MVITRRQGIIYAIAVLVLLAHQILRDDNEIDEHTYGSHQHKDDSIHSTDTSQDGHAGSSDDNKHIHQQEGLSSISGGIQYEITATNYGWNTPQKYSFSRRILSGELFNATKSHPRYNASAWEDLHSNPNPERRIIVFLDVDTCVESNYPVYGAKDWHVNVETMHPSPGRMIVNLPGESCQYIKKAVSSPALTANPDSRLILLDCCGVEKFRLRSACGRELLDNPQIIIAYYSIEKSSVRPLYDVGITPPAIKPVNLTTAEREDILTCSNNTTKQRKYLFSFQGRRGYGREALRSFENETDMYIRVYDERDKYKSDIQTNGADSNNYIGIMKQSTFAASPRGDLLFSYRFSEILSAGTIPVVYANNWLLPFNDQIVDWNKCAVFIDESDYDKTAEILRDISLEKRCEMQKCALNAWDRFASSRSGWIRGLVGVALSTSPSGINPLDSI